MDNAELKHMLEGIESENDLVQSQIAALQARSVALVKTADSVRALLEMTPEPEPWATSVVPPAGPAGADTLKAGHRTSAPRRARRKPRGKPKGKGAAKLVLESDQSRFWTVRDVHEEEVRLGLAEYRPPGAPGNPPSRIALDRLHKEHPENVEVQTTPVLAYKWTSQRIPSVNGSGTSHAEEA